MKNIKKFASSLVALFLVFAMTVMLLPAQEVKAASKIELDQKKITMCVGDMDSLTLLNAIGKVTWKSTKKKVAAVNSSGQIVAVGIGTCNIVAKHNKKTHKCKVTVDVDDITLSESKITLIAGGTFRLYADTDADVVNWQSSDNKVASVDSNGVVTAYGEGSAVITAKAGSQNDICVVNVLNKQIPVTDISLSDTAKSVVEGGTFQLAAKLTPADANVNNAITWKSSNTSIATVTSTGYVTAVKAGSCDITCTVGQFSKTCRVTVTQAPSITGITLSTSNVTLNYGGSTSVTASVSTYGSSNIDKTVTWTSSNPNVVSVTPTGTNNATCTLLGRDYGTAIITAKAGKFTKQITVTVTSYIQAISVSLSAYAVELEPGKNTTITYQVNPYNATNARYTGWTSGNTRVATVNQYGTITAVAAGTCVITCSTYDGAFAQCIVTVKSKDVVSNLTSNKPKMELKVGESDYMTVTKTPSNAPVDLIYYTDNSKIATIAYDGRVTGVAAGTTTVYCKDTVSGLVASSTVTVSVAEKLIVYWDDGMIVDGQTLYALDGEMLGFSSNLRGTTLTITGGTGVTYEGQDIGAYEHVARCHNNGGGGSTYGYLTFKNGDQAISVVVEVFEPLDWNW